MKASMACASYALPQGRARPLALVASGAAIALTLAGEALAQSTAPPSAAANPGAVGAGLLRNGEQLDRPNGEAAPPGAPAAAPPLTATGKGPSSFVLRGVVFGQSHFLSAASLNRIAAPLVGRTVSIADLRALVDAVNTVFARRGIVTVHAFLPPQKIDEGLVHVDIVEGRLGKLTVQAKGYTSKAYVQGFVPSQAQAVVDLPELRQSLLRFNRTNDAQLRAQLQPGAQTGATDIVLDVVEPPRTSLQLFSDSYGYDSTGHFEGGALLRRAGTLLQGDRTTLYINGSEGGITGNASYNIAVDHSGGRLGLSYGRSDTQVVSGGATAADIIGVSNTAAINYARPLVLGDAFSLIATGAFGWTGSTSDVASQSIGDSDVYKTSAGASMSGDLGRFGRYAADETLSYAYIDDQDLHRHDHAWEVNLDAQYVSPAFHRAYLKLSAAGQYYDSRTVPGTQVFQIGGVGSVRGYEVGAATGYAGASGSAEAHYDFSFLLRRSLDVYAFYDEGFVANGPPKDVTLDGAGVGGSINVWRASTFEFSYGHGFARAPNSRSPDRIEGRLVLAL